MTTSRPSLATCGLLRQRLGRTLPVFSGLLPFALASCTLGEPYVIEDGPTREPAEVTLASFESGTEGFAAPPSMADSSQLDTTTAFHSDGQRALAVTITKPQWLGVTFNSARNFSTRHRIKADLLARSAASRANLAIRSGASGWCELGFPKAGNLSPQVKRTLDARLEDLRCPGGDLGAVSGVYLWFDAGTFYIDNLRVE